MNIFLQKNAHMNVFKANKMHRIYRFKRIRVASGPWIPWKLESDKKGRWIHYFSMSTLNFPWILLLNVLLNILCWILVSNFAWSTFAHQHSLTSLIYQHKNDFPFLMWFSWNFHFVLFCLSNLFSIDTADMSKECLFQAAWLTESRFKDWLYLSQ